MEKALINKFPNGDIELTYCEAKVVVFYRRAVKLKFFRNQFQAHYQVTEDAIVGFKKITVKNGKVYCKAYDDTSHCYLLERRGWEKTSHLKEAA